MDRPSRESADDEMMAFLSRVKSYNIIFFDVETNGFVGRPMPSVLSASAIYGELRGKENCPLINVFNRFYYPREEYNPNALKTNGLTRTVVDEKRKNTGKYPEHFDEDYDAFKQFCNGVELFVGHNAVDFDSKFFPFMDWKSLRIFDTMTSNRDIVRGQWLEDRQQWKNPKLVEAVSFYKIESDSQKFHGSLYDSEMAAKIFLEMLKRATVRLKKLD